MSRLIPTRGAMTAILQCFPAMTVQALEGALLQLGDVHSKNKSFDWEERLSVFSGSYYRSLRTMSPRPPDTSSSRPAASGRVPSFPKQLATEVSWPSEAGTAGQLPLAPTRPGPQTRTGAGART